MIMFVYIEVFFIFEQFGKMEEPKVFYEPINLQVEEEEIPCSSESSDDSVKEAESKKHDPENEESADAREGNDKPNERDATPASASKGLKKRRRIDDD